MSHFAPRSLAFGLASAALVAGAVMAQGETHPAVKARQGFMNTLAFNLGVVGAMAQDKMPYDADAAATAAANLAALSKVKVGPMFVEGTDNFSRDDTRALPAIWEDMAGFEAHLTELASATEAMAGAAGNGLDALKGAMGPLGGACGGCHKDFRQSD